MDPIFSNLGEHIGIALSGATIFSIVAHGCNTFPTPTNKYGAWFLGLIQFAVGQRVAATNTFQGKDTLAVSISKGLSPEHASQEIADQVQQQVQQRLAKQIAKEP